MTPKLLAALSRSYLPQAPAPRPSLILHLRSRAEVLETARAAVGLQSSRRARAVQELEEIPAPSEGPWEPVP
jgi:hypothetical protein